MSSVPCRVHPVPPFCQDSDRLTVLRVLQHRVSVNDMRIRINIIRIPDQMIDVLLLHMFFDFRRDLHDLIQIVQDPITEVDISGEIRCKSQFTCCTDRQSKADCRFQPRLMIFLFSIVVVDDLAHDSDGQPSELQVPKTAPESRIRDMVGGDLQCFFTGVIFFDRGIPVSQIVYFSVHFAIASAISRTVYISS